MDPCSLHIDVRGVARLFVESVEYGEWPDPPLLVGVR